MYLGIWFGLSWNWMIRKSVRVTEWRVVIVVAHFPCKFKFPVLIDIFVAIEIYDQAKKKGTESVWSGLQLVRMRCYGVRNQSDQLSIRWKAQLTAWLMTPWRHQATGEWWVFVIISDLCFESIDWIGYCCRMLFSISIELKLSLLNYLAFDC